MIGDIQCSKWWKIANNLFANQIHEWDREREKKIQAKTMRE